MPEIRLIGSDGTQIGIVTPAEGLERARKEGLDLIEISPTARPPVCRIADFGKYVYTLEKEEKNARKKQHIVHLKEIKLRPKISEHDYQTKLRSAFTFLERGDMVKLTLMFRGRELRYVEAGKRVLNRFIEAVSEVAEVEKNLGLERNLMVVQLQPKPAHKKKQKKAELNAQAQNEQGGQETV